MADWIPSKEIWVSILASGQVIPESGRTTRVTSQPPQRPKYSMGGMPTVPRGNPISMSRRFIFVALYLTLTAAGALWYLHGSVLAAGNGSGEPVLVELFTSEGCSSCPPADTLLASLQSKSASGGAQPLVVLSEHVDYWDHDGWRDPFSSAGFTQRQSAYSERFGLSSIYTPQMVVDGQFEFVGSDRVSAGRAINSASAAQKVHIEITSASWQADTLTAKLQIAQTPAELRNATLYAALADAVDISEVGGGENSGRTLKHVSVVRVLQPLGQLGAAATESGNTAQLSLPDHRRHGQMQLVIFAQQPHLGPVMGVAARAL